MPYLFEEDEPAVILGFDIAVPEGWTEYDLSGDSVARMREQAVKTYANRPEELNALSDLLADIGRATRDATAGGLMAAAGAFEEYDDGFFMANVCVFSFPAGRGEYTLDPIKMIEHVYPDTATAREGTWLKKTTVEIPGCGSQVCGRIYGVTDYEMDDALVRSLVMHTSYTLPGLDKRIMVSCSSPNLLQLEEVMDLFDAISGTARFWFEEEAGTGRTAPA
ncbi:hypothetical protein [Nocardiopsis sp. CC223A]|uniref:hypothetical protein n=1 Tax=Nocardiopsis sp. CC223A TaxID=3044051 RepID=UPI00278BEA9C|nr:hypothetical protein [Nocardiopsis sp. CC223A]